MEDWTQSRHPPNIGGERDWTQSRPPLNIGGMIPGAIGGMVGAIGGMLSAGGTPTSGGDLHGWTAEEQVEAQRRYREEIDRMQQAQQRGAQAETERHFDRVMARTEMPPGPREQLDRMQQAQVPLEEIDRMQRDRMRQAQVSLEEIDRARTETERYRQAMTQQPIPEAMPTQEWMRVRNGQTRQQLTIPTDVLERLPIAEFIRVRNAYRHGRPIPDVPGLRPKVLFSRYDILLEKTIPTGKIVEYGYVEQQRS